MLLINAILKIRRDRRLNKKKKSMISLGVNVQISNTAVLEFCNKMTIGSNVYIGPGANINARGGVTIKSGVIIGPKLTIYSSNHNYKSANYIPYDQEYVDREVVINENVWIGGNVIIVPGAVVGEGAIIGAGCVVSGIIPPCAIVVGNPCRVVNYRDSKHYEELKKGNRIYLLHKINHFEG